MIIRNTFIISILALPWTICGQNIDCAEGDRLVSQQNYVPAVEKYIACYHADTLNKWPIMSLANCYMQLGDYTLAKQYYHQLEMDSTYKTEAISKLATIYESQQNLPKAIKYYLALSIAYSENPVYLRKLGNLYLQGREPKQALESYQQAYQINPRDLLTIQGLAEFYLSSDDLGKADSLANNGIKIDTNNVGLLLVKARIRYKARDYSTTAEILHKLTYQTELNNYYNKLLGYSFMQIDSLDKAIYHLQKSLLNENNPEYALYYLGIAYEKLKDYERSEYFYNEALKVAVSDNISNYHKGIARNSTNTSDYKKAIQNYTESLRYHDDPDTYFYLGNLSEQYYKDKSKALHWYQKYLSVKGGNSQFENFAKERVRLLKTQIFMKGSP